MGIVDEPDYEEYSLPLESGDRIYFFSDGITEAKNKEDTMLGINGLIRLIEKTRQQPLRTAMENLIDRFNKWCEPISNADDLSLLVLEIPR